MAINDELARSTTAVVLAGGKGTRLDPLTRRICKPALPFGGMLRCIDFSLSNCVNSGVRTIGVATQHEPDALLAHLWDRWNNSAVGDAAVIHAWRAEERAAERGYRGTADAVYRNLVSIRRAKDSLVLVLAGDHVYKMDYRPMLEAHRRRNADVTIGCTPIPVRDASHFGVLAADANGRIERFVEKPKKLEDVPTTSDGRALASMGIYVFDADLLADILEADALRLDSGHDFGCDVLPRLIAQGRAYSYALRDAEGNAGYWRDVGTLGAYWRAHMDLLGRNPPLVLEDPRWPLGRGMNVPHVMSAASAAGGKIEESIVSGSASVAGHLWRSIAFDDVAIGRGARIAETVLLPGASVGAGSRLQGVIVDAGYRVPEGAVVERQPGSDPPVLSAHLEESARYVNAR